MAASNPSKRQAEGCKHPSEVCCRSCAPSTCPLVTPAQPIQRRCWICQAGANGIRGCVTTPSKRAADTDRFHCVRCRHFIEGLVWWYASTTKTQARDHEEDFIARAKTKLGGCECKVATESGDQCALMTHTVEHCLPNFGGIDKACPKEHHFVHSGRICPAHRLYRCLQYFALDTINKRTYDKARPSDRKRARMIMLPQMETEDRRDGDDDEEDDESTTQDTRAKKTHQVPKPRSRPASLNANAEHRTAPMGKAFEPKRSSVDMEVSPRRQSPVAFSDASSSARKPTATLAQQSASDFALQLHAELKAFLIPQANASVARSHVRPEFTQAVSPTGSQGSLGSKSTSTPPPFQSPVAMQYIMQQASTSFDPLRLSFASPYFPPTSSFSTTRSAYAPELSANFSNGNAQQFSTYVPFVSMPSAQYNFPTPPFGTYNGQALDNPFVSMAPSFYGFAPTSNMSATSLLNDASRPGYTRNTFQYCTR